MSSETYKTIFKNGSKGQNNRGQKYTVVDYKGSDEVGLTFDSYPDLIQYHHAGSLRKGFARNKMDSAGLLGKRFENFHGEWVTVLKVLKAMTRILGVTV